jgi:hypothetical protein
MNLRLNFEYFQIAIGSLKGVEGADVYCLDKCLTNGSDCPEDRCRCR